MRTLLFLLFIGIVGCTSESSTISTLQKAGFTQIQPGGYAIFGCSKDDIFQTKFTAINSQGQEVEGVVCCGVFKNCTVRF